MRITIYLLFFIILGCSCKGGQKHLKENLLVEVNNEFLYKEDLQKALPQGLSPDDSLLFAENYIHNWVEDVLLYERAQTNIPDMQEIEKLVNNYRKSLVTHTYQQALISERLVGGITEEQTIDFYESNKKLFVTDRLLIKGLFLKIPLTAPQINEVRKWYRTETYEAVENLEKYSWQNAVSYEYFYDKWVPATDVLARIPFDKVNAQEHLKQNKHIEVKDTAFYYFLNVTEYLAEGDPQPYEFARPSVQEMLMNVQKVDFVKALKADLYKDASQKKRIKYNY